MAMALTACCGRQDLDVVAVGDGRVDRVPVERFAVDEDPHEAADVAIAIEDELAKTMVLGLDGFDTRPHRVGVDLDEIKASRWSPVARGNLYLRHLLVLRLGFLEYTRTRK